MVDKVTSNNIRARMHELLVRFEAFVAVSLDRCVKYLVDVRQRSCLVIQPNLESAFKHSALSRAIKRTCVYRPETED